MAADEVRAPTPGESASGRGQPQALRRGAVPFAGVLFQSITFMAPAIAAAFSIPAGFAFAGGAAPLAVIVALAAALIAASSVAQLAKHMPSAGSFYTYVSTSIHSGLGFLVAWVFELALLVGGAFLAVQIGIIVSGILSTDLGVSASLWWIWMVLGSVLVFVLGYLGIRASTGVGELLGAFEILVFLALAITLIVKAGGHNTLAVFGTRYATIAHFHGFSGVFAASVFSILAFIGFEEAAPIAEEAHNPRRHVQVAVLLSCLLIGLFYILTTYASTVFFGPHRMANLVTLGNSNPWQNLLARNAWGTVGYVDVFTPLFILLNLACIVYYARYRRHEFNWLLHGLLPALGIVAFIPAFLAGAGIPVFKFITPLPPPLSYAGPAVGVWLLIGIAYLIYLYVRHPGRVLETRRIFVDDEAR